MTAGLKPREQWGVEDWLDFNDGWHEASGLFYKSSRDAERTVVVTEPDPDEPGLRREVGRHPAAALIASGRTARDRHRGEHGI